MAEDFEVRHLNQGARDPDLLEGQEQGVGDTGECRREEKGNLCHIWLLIFILTFVLSFY